VSASIPTETLRDQLVEWLGTMPADEPYDYCWPSRCPLSQFAKTTGQMQYFSLSPNSVPTEIEEALNPLTYDPLNDFTFGALRERLLQATRHD
jgi:hypothetical protein